MKKIILYISLNLISSWVFAQSQLIKDTEADIMRDLAFAPAQSDRSMNAGQMIEVGVIFNSNKLTGSNPKGTRVLQYQLDYYDGFVGNHLTPIIKKTERWEIDCRQNITITYVNNKLRIVGNNIKSRFTELVNGAITKTSESNTVEIPDVSANKIYQNLANTLQFKLGALKIHIDRFYR
jgi:hypothetical protein